MDNPWLNEGNTLGILPTAWHLGGCSRQRVVQTQHTSCKCLSRCGQGDNLWKVISQTKWSLLTFSWVHLNVNTYKHGILIYRLSSETIVRGRLFTVENWECTYVHVWSRLSSQVSLQVCYETIIIYVPLHLSVSQWKRFIVLHLAQVNIPVKEGDYNNCTPFISPCTGQYIPANEGDYIIVCTFHQPISPLHRSISQLKKVTI